ncbi:MAG: RagB/SusD family nutrient uptake outer membrane protein [Muribaculaceae bacterium]|nr:RagB/SusD family nutrient uptake outer membrane protein [Muribaculaceae bacterium]
MKSYKFLTAAVAGLLFLNSCDLEMVPKGQTTLDSTVELEYILNTANYSQSKPFYNITVIANESYGDDYSSNVAGRIAKKNTLMAAYLSYDETIDRAALTASDRFYTDTYKLIFGLNVIIGKAPGSDGEDALKQRIMAEARVERAYYHFLIAGIYAAQYDKDTAADKGGIAYVTDYNNELEKTQLPLDKVYELMLEDLDDSYIAVLPERSNVVRLNKYSAYAIKARVLFQMKNYSEALTYALKALEGNSSIEDRMYILDTHRWILKADSPNNFWYISPQSTNASVNYSQLTLETIAKVEPGDLTFDYAYANGRVAAGNEVFNARYGQMDSGITGCRELTSYDVQTNSWGLTVERIMYLAAECYIRANEIQKGLDLVNQVRKFRIHPDQYRDFAASNVKEAMALLQQAKFIENLSTYENFFDLKRWNSEADYRQTITREVPGSGTYTLTPDSPLWIMPFPSSVLEYNTSFKQNY